MLDAICRSLTALCAAAVLAGPVMAPARALAQDDGERRDVTIGNPDRMRTGTNERGDSVMSIESKPKQKQQVPNMGPIYVVPQVNQGGRPGNQVIIPVTPPQTQDDNYRNRQNGQGQ